MQLDEFKIWYVTIAHDRLNKAGKSRKTLGPFKDCSEKDACDQALKTVVDRIDGREASVVDVKFEWDVPKLAQSTFTSNQTEGEFSLTHLVKVEYDFSRVNEATRKRLYTLILDVKMYLSNTMESDYLDSNGDAFMGRFYVFPKVAPAIEQILQIELKKVSDCKVPPLLI